MTTLRRYLFELVWYYADRGVARMSEWITDEWLADELRMDPNLDRVVEFELAGFHELPDEPQFIVV